MNMSTATQTQEDPVTAALGRSMTRFAQKFGVNQSETTTAGGEKGTREAEMPATAAVQKTAGENAENDMKGSQLQTGEDKGDYGSQSEQVAKQKAETAESAPEGTEEKGSQVQTSQYDDKSYSQNSSGGARLAKNKRALAAVLSISESDPKAAARLIHAVEGASSETTMSGDDKGEKVGGPPDTVADDDDVTTAPVAAPAATPPAQAVPQDQVTETKLQETINDKQQAADIQKQVIQELTKVLDNVTAAEKKLKAEKDEKKDKKEEKKEEKDKEKDAAKRKTANGTADSTPVKMDEMGNGKVPHAAMDAKEHPQSDGDPDKTGFQQSTGASEKIGEGHVGQPYAESSDRDYKHARVKLREQVTVASRALSNEVQKLVTSKKVASIEAAIETLAKTPFGQKLVEAKKRLAEIEKKSADDATGRDVGGNVPPDEQKSNQADDTNRYESKEQGDTDKDDIAPGTDNKLESPETGSVVDQGRGELTSKHNDDVQGATVANKKLSAEFRTKTSEEVAKFQRATGTLVDIAKAMKDQPVTPVGRSTLAATVERSVTAMKQVVASITEVLGKELISQDDRTSLARRITEGRTLVDGFKCQAAMMKVITAEAESARTRFNRVAPSFRLAIKMVEADTIPLAELPAQVGEFIRMSPEQFEASEKMAMKVASRQPTARPRERVASRLPSIVTEGSGYSPGRDELTDIFDDE